mmetsp:Transcript_16754/g.57189  ORF Transcript_16754/g.57189 Transcript_16754/m.57189 type:complete len:745 (-) Transcript_16754:3551-5785(-)
MENAARRHSTRARDAERNGTISLLYCSRRGHRRHKVCLRRGHQHLDRPPLDGTLWHLDVDCRPRRRAVSLGHLDLQHGAWLRPLGDLHSQLLCYGRHLHLPGRALHVHRRVPACPPKGVVLLPRLRRGEPHEYLLQRRLRDGVVLHLEAVRVIAPEFLDGGEEPAELLARAVDVVLHLRLLRLHHRGVGQLGRGPLLQLGQRIRLDADLHVVPAAVLVLEVLHGAEAAEAALHHDAQVVAQRLALLHGVGRKHDGAALQRAADDVPHEAARLRVHARGGLVEQDDGGVTHERDGHGQLPLVAAAVAAARAVRVALKVHLLDQLAHRGVHVPLLQAADARVEAQQLARGHVEVDAVELGAVANVLARLRDLIRDGVRLALLHQPAATCLAALDVRVTRGGLELAREHLEGGGLAGTVDTQQAETLALGDTDAHAAHGVALVRVLLGKVLEDHHVRRLGRFQACNALALRDHVVVFLVGARRGRALPALQQPVAAVRELEKQRGSEEGDTLEEEEQEVLAADVHVEHVFTRPVLYGAALIVPVRHARHHLVLADVVHALAQAVVRQEAEDVLKRLPGVLGARVRVSQRWQQYASKQGDDAEEPCDTRDDGKGDHWRLEEVVAHVRHGDACPAEHEKQDEDAAECFTAVLFHVEGSEDDHHERSGEQEGEHVHCEVGKPEHDAVHAAHHLQMLGIVVPLPHDINSKSGTEHGCASDHADANLEQTCSRLVLRLAYVVVRERVIGHLD